LLKTVLRESDPFVKHFLQRILRFNELSLTQCKNCQFSRIIEAGKSQSQLNHKSAALYEMVNGRNKSEYSYCFPDYRIHL